MAARTSLRASQLGSAAENEVGVFLLVVAVVAVVLVVVVMAALVVVAIVWEWC